MNLAKYNLENIENQKSIFIRQALEQGKKIFSEVRDMSNLSRVKLDGKNRQTLFIDIPEKPDPECENAMRIALQNFLISLREENFDAVNNKQLLRKKIEKTFSNRELLNIVIGKRHIPVKLYTVDATNGIGSLRKWEDVIVQNSGAQMFISAFAFISTLIDYERHRISESNGSNETFSKVFIIDNPFGKTSSKTFLDAMIAVSKKFKCQLICLSDLNQSSITNQFNVIYQLALKTPLYSNKSYLKIEKPIISGDVSKNSRLEHISMKTEQMTLF